MSVTEPNALQKVMQPASPPLSLHLTDLVKGLLTSGALSAVLGFLASNSGIILSGHPAEAALASAVIGYLIDLLHRYAGGDPKPNGVRN